MGEFCRKASSLRELIYVRRNPKRLGKRKGRVFRLIRSKEQAQRAVNLIEGKLNKEFTVEDVNRKLGLIIRRFSHTFENNVAPPHKAVNHSSYFLLRLYLNKLNFSLRQKRNVSELFGAIQKGQIHGFEYPEFELDRAKLKIVQGIVSKHFEELYKCVSKLERLLYEDSGFGEYTRFSNYYIQKGKNPENYAEKLHLLKHGKRDLDKKIVELGCIIEAYKRQTTKR